MVTLSRLFAFMYLSRLRRFLGMSWAGWIRLIPLFLLAISLLFGWPLLLSLLWFLLFIVIWLLYGIVGRLGYKRFVADSRYELAPEAAPLKPNKRVELRATGVFSLNDREDYVLQHRAEYWRIDLGKHVFMVQHRPGRYLYQIIMPEYIQTIEAGYLLFGSAPKRALALSFLVTWGPEYSQYQLYYIGADNVRTPKQKRTVFLTFGSEEALQQVWRSLQT